MDKILKWRVPYDHVDKTEVIGNILTQSTNVKSRLADLLATGILPAPDKPLIVLQKDSDTYQTLESIWCDASPDLRQLMKPGFDIATKHINGCCQFIAMILGHTGRTEKPSILFPHIHPRLIKDIDCLAFTTVIPLKIVEPITEQVMFKWTDVIYPAYTDYSIKGEFEKDCRESLDRAVGPEQVLIFPAENEILAFDFNASRYPHLVSGLSENLYLVLLFDARDRIQETSDVVA